jgi:hypothetical protein
MVACSSKPHAVFCRQAPDDAYADCSTQNTLQIHASCALSDNEGIIEKWKAQHEEFKQLRDKRFWRLTKHED